MTEDLDKILGQKINDVKLLIWSEKKSAIMIEKILFEFDDCRLILQVNPDSDSIIPQISNDITLPIKEKEHQVISSKELLDHSLHCLIGNQIAWLWTLTNNQGYFDAIQIEMENRDAFQFLTIASQIEISKVVKM
jgi:hypothetical protein